MVPPTHTLFDPLPRQVPEVPVSITLTPEPPPAEPPPGPSVPTAQELLRQGFIPTQISPHTAKVMTALFILGIGLLPILQTAYEVIKQRRTPQALTILTPAKDAAVHAKNGELRRSLTTLKYMLTKEHLHKWEQQLEEASVFKRQVKPRLQHAMLRAFGFSHGDVTIPRQNGKPTGWLFYHVGNGYLAGPPFLDPAILKQREKKMYVEEDDVNADPRKAIIAFHEDCKAAGVYLVFVPVPTKCMLHPGELNPALKITGKTPVPNNPSYPQFLADLRAAGVDVFDPTPAHLTPHDKSRYLMQDTHWTPQWMESVAEQLARHVQGKVPLPPAPPLSLRIEEQQIENFGDILQTMALPASQTLFEKESTTIKSILDARTNQPLQWDSASDVVFLGDSFSNIFSDPTKGWGQAAGFPYHVARFLNRNLDALVRDGAAATDLREELAARQNPLKGKRLIIWQVAMHELPLANWRIVPVPAPEGASN